MQKPLRVGNLRKLRREMQRQGLGSVPGEAELHQRHSSEHSNTRVIRSPNVEKMSEIIEDFAEPLLRHGGSLEDFKKSLGFAIVAWNYATTPHERRDELQASLRFVRNDPVLKDVFDFLVVRKEAAFSHVQRFILDYEVRQNGSDFALSVISTI